MHRNRQPSYALGALSLAVLVTLAACGKSDPAADQNAAPPPLAVGTVTITPSKEAVVNELPGRLEASRVAEVRARVAGVVLKRAFREGSDVKAGEVLFQIDPAPFQADYQSAQANLQRDEANLYQAKALAERYEPLVKANAVSKQEYDNAVAGFKQAQAAVAASRAAVVRSKLSLDYATVKAPISGRIGRALVTEGALVGQGEVTPLATVQQLDPIYVNITQPVSELNRLRSAFDAGSIKKVAENEARVSLVMEDGTVYGQSGRLLFSDVSVDPTTNQVTLRALVPNPQMRLLPGMYVRTRVEQGVDEATITVPQQAVQRDAGGGSSVFVVGAENKVEVRPVQTGSALGDRWVVTSGLQANDVVIVEGFQKIRPGAPVEPTQWKAQSESNVPASPAAQ